MMKSRTSHHFKVLNGYFYKKVKTMKDLTNVIINYLETTTTGALMISGDWGCGKTYHIDNVVFPKLREKSYIPIRVSLFGMSSINELPTKIIDNYIDSFGSKMDKLIKTGSSFVKKATTAALSISKIDNLDINIDINKFFESNNNFWYRLIPPDKTLIVLDDLERATKNIDIHILLGTINDLIEQRKYKIVIVSNNSYLDENEKNNLVFKEKVIEKTIVYKPDIVNIYRDILTNGKYKLDYKTFMQNNDCISIIDPNNSIYKSNIVKRNLNNIRILKFTIEHFYKIYSCLSKIQENKHDEDFIVFLKSLWACTVGISIEYKKNKITNQDKKAYSGFADIPSYFLKQNENDLINELFESEEEQEEKQKDISSSEKIRYIYKTYVTCHNLPIVISVELFDFITAEYTIDEDGLVKTWEDFKRKTLKTKTSSAYMLLDNFIKSVWSFTNKEMPQKLNKLASYVKKGEYNDNLSYVNAATFLLHYQQLTNYSMDDMQNIIRQGIDKMYKRITKILPLMEDQLNMIENGIPEISKWVIQYERDKMQTHSLAKKSDDIKKLIKLFDNNITDFAKRIIPYPGNNLTIDFINVPILSHIPAKKIIKKMQSISPEEVVSLQSIINYRFGKYSSDDCKTQEFPFIEYVVEGITKRNNKKKIFSDYIIEDQLNQTIEKIKKDYY